MSNQNRLSGSQVNKYGFYLMASSLAAMVQMTYLTIFMTDSIGIPIAAMGTMLLIARFIDLIIGTLCGGIIEKVHMPWGKYRSWLLVLRWVIIFSLVCSFFDSNAFPLGVRLAISFVGYMLLNVSMSFTTNAYYALGPALAGANLEDRNRLSARGAQFMCVAMLLTSALTVPCVNFLTPKVGSAFAYMIVAVVFALPYLIGTQMVSNLCKDVDPDGKRVDGMGGPTITIKDMIDSVVQNKQLLVMFMSLTIYYVGMYIISNMATYYFSYIVGNYTLISVSMTITMITGFLASMVMPKYGAKLGKKKAFVIALVIYACSYIGVYFLGGIDWKFYTLCAVIGGGAMYMFSTFGANYFVDCGEYHLYKTGKDTRMIAISMYSVPMKIGMMLGGAVANYGMAMIGYQAGMEVTASFKNGFMVILGLIPAGLVLLAALINQVGYKITDADAAFYAAENAKRAAAAAEHK